MLKDIISIRDIWVKIHKKSLRNKAFILFLDFLEQRVGGNFIYDYSHCNYEPLELLDLLGIADSLQKKGFIKNYSRNRNLPDEPKITSWGIQYLSENESDQTNFAGGSSFEDERLALAKAISEAIERNAWFTFKEFPGIHEATVSKMRKNNNSILPEKFVSYTKKQIKENPKLQITESDSFLWIKGYSWIANKPVWLPVQTVSGNKDLRGFSLSSKEPVIRSSITNGLATHPKKINALLLASLEIIERDAYMITWLNQISPEKIDINEFLKEKNSLSKLIKLCKQYRLLPHILSLPTDAPAYVVSIVLEDLSETLPRFTLGLKAHRNLAAAIEGAILEALRMHKVIRLEKKNKKNNWNKNTKAVDIRHLDRLLYWSEPERSERLNFLIKGKKKNLKNEIWENDTDKEHFERIVSWCKDKKYELASVSFSNSPSNIPKWNIEIVVIPEMQPIYFNEKLPQIGGIRLREIPEKFGYLSRKPYTEDPHPFA